MMSEVPRYSHDMEPNEVLERIDRDDGSDRSNCSQAIGAGHEHVGDF